VVVDIPRWRRWTLRWSLAIVITASLSAANAVDLVLPNRIDSLKFAVTGDLGTGERAEYEVAAQMAALRMRFPFEMVILVGDNIIGRQSAPSDFVAKFEQPFRSLLQAGTRFHAALGNHDKPANRFYPPWNMAGQRYYTFATGNVRFFALDSNKLDRPQLAWIEQALRTAKEDWRICYFHHPLYSDGVKHGPALESRVILEPLLVKYGVDVVFSGHDHVYERLKPQKGIHYFVIGPGGQSPREIRPSDATAASFDRERSFTIVEVSRDELHFQTVSRTGALVDAGVLRRRPKT
jgi:3',5'-cyclic AMP phosphodiesterase CpdA